MAGILKNFFREKPLISLLHTTARTGPASPKAAAGWSPGWTRAFDDWRLKADNPGAIEYVLCVDADDPNRFGTARTVAAHEVASQEISSHPPYKAVHLVENFGRKCAVDGWNRAAQASEGKLLITVSDDLFPPDHWDTLLLQAVADLDRQAVVDIEAGSGALMTFSLLTRAYYERYGYIFHPDYFGMFGDNHFTSQAHRDGVVIPARNLVFTHEHPAYGTAQSDEVYAWQHRAEAWAAGKRAYKKHFPDQYREVIAAMLPGEIFSNLWVANWSTMLCQLAARHLFQPHFAFSSNVHVTRGALVDGITTKLGAGIPPDYVFWIDDDNLPSSQHFDMLLKDLHENPDLDMVVGWCWAGQHGRAGDPPASCGLLSADELAVHFDHSELMAGDSDLVPIEFSGFPTVLMRYSLLQKLGANPFAPLLNEKHPWGFNSEDTSFCIRAKRAGVKMACDRRVKVQHLKLGYDERPVMPAKSAQNVDPQIKRAAAGPVRTENAA